MKLLVNNQEIANLRKLEWSDSLDNTASSISFETDCQIEPGLQFALIEERDNTKVMEGIIAEYSQINKDIFSYTGYDFGFYLNHNSIVKQFNGVKISDAIKCLCRDFQIPYGNIPQLNATIRKIYKNIVLSDCLKGLLKLAQTKMNIDYYYLTCSSGALNIEKYQVINDLSAYMSDLSISSTDTLKSPKIIVSMEDMRNQVIIVDNATDSIAKRFLVKDDNSIKHYGLLQHVEEVDKDIKNSFKMIASNKLKELNKLNTAITINDMLGCYRIRKGVIIPIDNKYYDINGYFLVKSSKHKITKTKELVSVNLEKYDISKLG